MQRISKIRYDLRMRLWLLFFPLFLFATYQSQYGQDRFVNETIFKNKKSGIFIDIGAYDGKTFSNSYFFEKELGWMGICIEPLPSAFEKLKKVRKALCIQGAIAKENGTASFNHVEGSEMLSGLIDEYHEKHLERIAPYISSKISVTTYNLNDLLEKNGIREVDFLSLDTEGGELEILQSIDFDKFSIEVITVENNYNSKEIKRFLKTKGYSRIKKLHCDEVYKKNRGLLFKIKKLFTSQN